MKWYLKVIRHYADFSGRARRTEYWMFVLFNFIFALAALLIDNIFRLTFVQEIPYGVVYLLYIIAMMLPSLAVAVRRLHDTGKSGWMFLISLIPIVGGIWLLVLMCTDSKPNENHYGKNPKATEETDTKPGMQNAAVALIVASAVYLAASIGIDAGIFFHPHYIMPSIPAFLLSKFFYLVPLLLMIAGIALFSRKNHVKTAAIAFISAAVLWVFACVALAISIHAVTVNLLSVLAPLSLLLVGIVMLQESAIIPKFINVPLRTAALCLLVASCIWGLILIRWQIMILHMFSSGLGYSFFLNFFYILLPIALIVLANTLLHKNEMK